MTKDEEVIPMDTTLLIMAAGIGSRFGGGIKQLEPVDANGHIIMDYSGIAIVLYLNQYPYQPRERDYAYAGSFYAFAIWIGFGVLYLWDLLQKKMDSRNAAIIVTAVCLFAVPVNMAAQNWDDHDRDGRYATIAHAKNYLSTCAPNAILFTYGDNDTFPLWYAQEVEGFRRDVRIVNLSLLAGDWYIDQMKRKAYESDGKILYP